MTQQSLDLKVSRIYKLQGAGSMRAFVDIKINDQILLRGLKIIDGSQGLFVSMPQEKGKDKKWYETIRCLSKETRSQLDRVVLEAYQNETK